MTDFLSLLPLEICKKIFNLFNPNELINLRRVNKKLKIIIENYIIIKKLVIKSAKTPLRKLHYSFNFDHIGHNSIFFTENVHCLTSNVIKTIFKNNLQQLFIDFEFLDKENRLFNFANSLSQFSNLIQIEINVIRLDKGCSIVLQKLEILTVRRVTGDKKLRLFTPVLCKFKSDTNLEKFVFMYEDKITELALQYYESEVEKFKNLRKFFCKEIGQLSNNLLRNHPFLLELHTAYPVTKTTVFNLLSNKMKLKRIDFKFYFHSLRIDNLNELEAYSERNHLINLKANFEIALVNYSKLHQLAPFFDVINYNRIMKFFKNQINFDFFKKFINIKKIEAQNLIDFKLFSEFLVNCQNLIELNLSDCKLNQWFCDNLHICAPYLVTIEIENHEMPLQPEFISKLLRFNSVYFEFKIKNKLIKLCGNDYSNNFIRIENQDVYFESKSHFLAFLKEFIMVI